jgi:hypothetical protein
VGTILSNEHAEALILSIRTGREASRTEIGGRAGGFAVLPTSIVTGGRRGGQVVCPLRVGVEPGSMCTGAVRADVSGRVGDVEVSGWFWLTIGDGTPPPARYDFQIAGHRMAAPLWAVQLPHSTTLARRWPLELERDRARLVRHGELAEHRLLRLTEQVLESCCRGPLRSVLTNHRLVEEADLVQRGLDVALRLLPVYASPRRPPRAWLGMVHLDGKRDMHRAVSQLDWLPRDLTQVVQRAHLAGIQLDSDPDVTLAALADAALDNGQALLRVTAEQVRTALTTPEMESFDAPWGGGHAWQPPEGGLSAPDPALDAVESQPGRTAATIAALVSSDPATIAGAFLGDPTAVQQVAEQLLARLRRRGEPLGATRHRTRQKFLSSGRLLRGAAFPGVPAGRLGALDASLREALDLEPVA